jgi:serine-type D-Ala-D-Ala carboxypeptidase
MASLHADLSGFLQSKIDEGAFPSAQYLIGDSGRIVAEGALGFAVVEPELIAATSGTVYDLASLTKPLVTALLAVILTERGMMDLLAPVAEYVPEFCAAAESEGARATKMIDLLVHTSGLPGWRPLYTEARSRQEVTRLICRIANESALTKETKPVVYSDLNYVLAGMVIERLSGEPLDRVAAREIFDRLGLERTMFNPPGELKRQIAATERGRTGGLAASDEVTWGVVHDDNAFFMSGVAGHAGLFSTAEEVFRLANEFLPGSRLVGPDRLRLFRTNFTSGRGDDRSVGWLLASTTDCSAGPSLPATAFGHTGFTGTSLWIDPERERVFILLTNRLHPTAGSVDMKTVRQRFHIEGVKALTAG